jgi:hypothetical protein
MQTATTQERKRPDHVILQPPNGMAGSRCGCSLHGKSTPAEWNMKVPQNSEQGIGGKFPEHRR